MASEPTDRSGVASVGRWQPATTPLAGAGSAVASPAPRRRPWHLVGVIAVFLAGVLGINQINASGTRSRHESACASVLNVVNPAGSTFERHSAGLGADDATVRLHYTVRLPDGRDRRTVILCAFETSTSYAVTPRLVAVTVNGQALGPARLAFLNRFWLPSDAAAAELPTGDPSSPPSRTGETVRPKTVGGQPG